MEYNFNRFPDETAFQQLVRISVDKVNKLHSMDWIDVKETFNFQHSAESLRKYAVGWNMIKQQEDSYETDENISSEQLKYKNTTEIKGDGSFSSNKLISMNEEQSKNPDYILEAHGFDKNKWELVSAKNSIWNANGKDETKTLFSSKVSVKPKVNGFDMDKFLEKIEDIKPITIESKANTYTEVRMLEIPLYDMHFGIATLEEYLPVYKKVLDKIESKKWSKILFTIGQDLLHTEGFTGHTTSGTMIGKINMEKAWSDAYTFYNGLIKESLRNSEDVEIVFSDGNHDKAMGWAFTKTLEATFPQVKFDTEMKKFKAFTWEEVFIGITHGDKGANRVEKVFLAEYGNLIAKAKVKELHLGHLHHQITKDNFGIVQRTLGSGVPSDDYHTENGFIGAVKTFQLFEYSPDKLEAIYYV